MAKPKTKKVALMLSVLDRLDQMLVRVGQTGTTTDRYYAGTETMRIAMHIVNHSKLDLKGMRADFVRLSEQNPNKTTDVLETARKYVRSLQDQLVDRLQTKVETSNG